MSHLCEDRAAPRAASDSVVDLRGPVLHLEHISLAQDPLVRVGEGRRCDSPHHVGCLAHSCSSPCSVLPAFFGSEAGGLCSVD